MSQFPTTKQSCHPLSYHSLMVRPEHAVKDMLITSTEQIIPVHSLEEMTIYGSYIHARTGECLRDVEVNLHADATVYFVASKLAGWYFVMQFSSFYQRYGCSCFTGKQYQQTGKRCDHMIMMAARETSAVA